MTGVDTELRVIITPVSKHRNLPYISLKEETSSFAIVSLIALFSASHSPLSIFFRIINLSVKNRSHVVLHSSSRYFEHLSSTGLCCPYTSFCEKFELKSHYR
jgi:hypothetical protein